MTKAEMILKLVMAPTIKHYTSFVDQYLKLLPESDMTEFQKILEMKVCGLFILNIVINYDVKHYIIYIIGWFNYVTGFESSWTKWAFEYF